VTVSPDHLRLLQHRAATLASPLVDEDRTPLVDLVVVSVAGRRLAFRSDSVRQVLRNGPLCRLPQGCGALLGLVAVSGTAVPVADLGALLEDSSPEPGRPLIVLLGGPAPVGVLVDDALSVLSLRTRDIRPRPPGSPSDSAECGITSEGVVVLDTEILLSHPRLNPRSTSEQLPAGRSAHPDASGE